MDDDDYQPISALNDLLFCERRCAMHRVEQVWVENRFTLEGTAAHKKVHAEPSEEELGAQGRVVRGLWLRSDRLKLVGVADLVEFRPANCGVGVPPAAPNCGVGVPPASADYAVGVPPAPTNCAVDIPPASADYAVGVPPASADYAVGVPPASADYAVDIPPAPLSNSQPEAEKSQIANCGEGAATTGATPYPVEYKRGKRRRWNNDDVQLCAQALCLEEMLGTPVAAGAVFHVTSRRRREVVFDAALRARTEDAARRLHELFASGETPPPVLKPRCRGCSLHELCLPETLGERSRAAAYQRTLFDVAMKDEG